MRFLTLTLAAMALMISALAQPVCAPTWLWFDVEPAQGTTVESVYFWVTPLNGLTVVYAEGDLGFWNGGSSTSEAQACLPEGCYFVGLDVPEGATWEAHADFVVDDLSWEMTEMEPMYDEAGNVSGYTFCVNNVAQGGCEVAISTELGVGPNGAYLFEAMGGPDGAQYTWSVSGSVLQSSESALFEWYDMLGAPWWEVCVMMVTPDGCGAMDCVTPADLVQDCTLELAGGLNPSGGGVFEAFNYPDSVLINWSIDGNWLNFGGPVLELGPDVLTGVSVVCAFYETPECPNGVWACMELGLGGCVDDSMIDPNMACTEEYNPVCGCDGNTYSNACYATYYGGVTEYTMGACGDGGCIDESLIDPNAICPLIWNPVCGCDGVTYGNPCEAENFGGVTQYTPGECGSTGGCEPIIEAWPSDVPGVWNFLVYDVSNPVGGPLSEDDLEWEGNGQVIGGDGPNGATQVAFWGTNDFLFVVCVSVMCEEEVIQVCWENPNVGQTEGECENVVIALNAEWGSASGVDALELELVLSMLDVDVELDLSQVLEGGSFNETLAFCLPVGYCYALEAALSGVDLSDIDVFQIAAGVGQELPAWQDVLATLESAEDAWSYSLGVEVLEDCEDADNLLELHREGMVAVYPNPASHWLTFSGMPSGQNIVTVRNALGQLLLEADGIQNGDVLYLPEALSGMLLVELQGGDWRAVQRIVVN